VNETKDTVVLKILF